MKKITIIAGISLAVIAYISAVYGRENVIDRSFSVSNGGTLYVDSDSGSIDVESHAEDTVKIEVYKKGHDADEFEVSLEQNGGDIIIKGDKESSWGSYNLSVNYRITVPQYYNLELKTGGGSIEITELKGNVQAFTSGGSITLDDIEGDVDVKTSGGSIRVEDVAGNVDAHTSGGSIKAKLSQQLTQDCSLVTSGGSITAYLIESIAVDLRASTSGGRVRSDFTVDGRVKKNKIEGVINGGGPRLTLRTSGGSVSIREL